MGRPRKVDVDMCRQFASISLIATSLFVGACMPARAPGSDPGDMTAAGHCAAAAHEHREAAEHRAEATRVQPTKPANERMQVHEHRVQAERHDRYAADHAAAAGRPCQ